MFNRYSLRDYVRVTGVRNLSRCQKLSIDQQRQQYDDNQAEAGHSRCLFEQSFHPNSFLKSPLIGPCHFRTIITDRVEYLATFSGISPAIILVNGFALVAPITTAL